MYGRFSDAGGSDYGLFGACVGGIQIIYLVYRSACADGMGFCV